MKQSISSQKNHLLKVSKIKKIVSGATNSVLNVFQQKKFDNVKFEDSLIEKLANTIINLLRKSVTEDDLCIPIMTLLIKFIKLKSDISNMYIKAVCPRILLQIIDCNFNNNLIALALELLKLIAQSSDLTFAYLISLNNS